MYGILLVSTLWGWQNLVGMERKSPTKTFASALTKVVPHEKQVKDRKAQWQETIDQQFPQSSLEGLTTEQQRQAPRTQLMKFIQKYDFDHTSQDRWDNDFYQENVRQREAYSRAQPASQPIQLQPNPVSTPPFSKAMAIQSQNDRQFGDGPQQTGGGWGTSASEVQGSPFSHPFGSGQQMSDFNVNQPGYQAQQRANIPPADFTPPRPESESLPHDVSVATRDEEELKEDDPFTTTPAPTSDQPVREQENVHQPVIAPRIEEGGDLPKLPPEFDQNVSGAQTQPSAPPRMTSEEFNKISFALQQAQEKEFKKNVYPYLSSHDRRRLSDLLNQQYVHEQALFDNTFQNMSYDEKVRDPRWFSSAEKQEMMTLKRKAENNLIWKNKPVRDKVVTVMQDHKKSIGLMLGVGAVTMVALLARGVGASQNRAGRSQTEDVARGQEDGAVGVLGREAVDESLYNPYAVQISEQHLYGRELQHDELIRLTIVLDEMFQKIHDAMVLQPAGPVADADLSAAAREQYDACRHEIAELERAWFFIELDIRYRLDEYFVEYQRVNDINTLCSKLDTFMIRLEKTAAFDREIVSEDKQRELQAQLSNIRVEKIYLTLLRDIISEQASSGVSAGGASDRGDELRARFLAREDCRGRSSDEPFDLSRMRTFGRLMGEDDNNNDIATGIRAGISSEHYVN